MRAAGGSRSKTGASDDRAIGDSWLETMRLVSTQSDASVLHGTGTRIEWCVWSKDREHKVHEAALTPGTGSLSGPVVHIWT
jgi:hypothetical protein